MSEQSPSFQALGLPSFIIDTLNTIGYETPSPIQAAAIPALMEGRDVLGQAQTGTGKTAAFALPTLGRLDTSNRSPQVLVLTPTRELAIQVAEAYQSYARGIPGFHVLPVYGGQAYGLQLKPLRRGCHVVVGTPGRLMDHMRRNTLSLDNLQTLVLDEADEMLRMGFQEDVEWILGHVPDNTQTALFSATLPPAIKKVAESCLKDPVRVKIASATRTAPTIRQRFWQVSGLNKLDALTRILETEDFDGIILFVRTRNATLELAEKLSARGFAAEALNGDMPQPQREKIVERLKAGNLDILVATDVVGRGLDVERISHVINYDIPYDTEAYIHRIGRTGRAGRSGDAILFVAPREKRMLRSIEKATGQTIERLQLPSAADVNQNRVSRFKQRIVEAVAEAPSSDIELYEGILNDVIEASEESPTRIAAALMALVQGDSPLLLPEKEPRVREEDFARREDRSEGRRERRSRDNAPDNQAEPLPDSPEILMERFVMPIGREDGVTPSQVVGAIANEAELDSCYIGQINIRDSYTTVDLPQGMPKEVLLILQKARICGKASAIQPFRSLDDLPVRKKSSRPPKKGGKYEGKGGKFEGKRKYQGKSDKKRPSGKGGGEGRPARKPRKKSS